MQFQFRLAVLPGVDPEWGTILGVAGSMAGRGIFLH